MDMRIFQKICKIFRKWYAPWLKMPLCKYLKHTLNLTLVRVSYTLELAERRIARVEWMDRI